MFLAVLPKIVSRQVNDLSLLFITMITAGLT